MRSANAPSRAVRGNRPWRRQSRGRGAAQGGRKCRRSRSVDRPGRPSRRRNRPQSHAEGPTASAKTPRGSAGPPPPKYDRRSKIDRERVATDFTFSDVKYIPGGHWPDPPTTQVTCVRPHHKERSTERTTRESTARTAGHLSGERPLPKSHRAPMKDRRGGWGRGESDKCCTYRARSRAHCWRILLMNV